MTKNQRNKRRVALYIDVKFAEEKLDVQNVYEETRLLVDVQQHIISKFKLNPIKAARYAAYALGYSCAYQKWCALVR